MADIAEQIVKLRQDVAKAQRLRAEAEGNLAAAKTRLAENDAALKKLGLDPEKADVELAALEKQLESTVTELQQSVTIEIAKYQEIIQASKQVLSA